jgi:hypothetical protein
VSVNLLRISGFYSSKMNFKGLKITPLLSQKINVKYKN